MTDFFKDFRDVLTSCGLEEYATRDFSDRFEKLTELLLLTNAHTNLTAITEQREIICKHYADCLLIAHLIPKGANLLDVGCGGGFPTLPLALVRPDLVITALDSTAKKLDFVAYASEQLQLSVKILPGRAEIFGKNQNYRETFDTVTARAVANLRVLSEWCLPFVRVGGLFVAMKGADGERELQEAGKALQILGASLAKSETKELNGARRCNIVLRKTSSTPAKYPRENGAITKKPL